jgi:vitamin-K-epoxide reductase (warfarin-sensitive)
MMTCALFLAAIGFALSLYAYLVDKKLKADPTYTPACDISDNISCSKVATSPYANLLSVPNAVIGMFFYALVMLFAWFGYEQLLMVAVIAGALISLYLAYLLYFKIKSLCLVCIATYIVNGALLVCVLW